MSSYFSIENAVSLGDLPKKGRIHVIGVCGVAMAQLSIALTELGFAVSGSDKEFYEPMGSLLRRSKVILREGYSASNITDDISAVIIGNAVTREHEEVLEVERKRIPFTLFPKVLYELCIADKHSIVVSGTHGKSTTTALMASVLQKLGLDSSYFIGGVARDLPQSLHAGKGNFSVVEGDEYDSAFFAKIPKFSFYRPNTLIVTSIEFDHADIYASLEEIKDQFSRMISSMDGGTVIYCADFPAIQSSLEQWKTNSKVKFLSYGSSTDSQYRIIDCNASGNLQKVSFVDPEGNSSEFFVSLFGEHNAKNAISVLIALNELNLKNPISLGFLESFQGVKRRQEVRYDDRGITLLEDFAHHPTAVRETIRAVKKSYPHKKLWAIFEPRSNTSRRKVFQKAYENAFELADKVILSEVAVRKSDAGLDIFSVDELSKALQAAGKDCTTHKDVSDILSSIKINPGDEIVIVIMSNGSFGGLTQSLENRFRNSIV